MQRDAHGSGGGVAQLTHPAAWPPQTASASAGRGMLHRTQPEKACCEPCSAPPTASKVALLGVPSRLSVLARLITSLSPTSTAGDQSEGASWCDRYGARQMGPLPRAAQLSPGAGSNA